MIRRLVRSLLFLYIEIIAISTDIAAFSLFPTTTTTATAIHSQIRIDESSNYCTINGQETIVLDETTTKVKNNDNDNSMNRRSLLMAVLAAGTVTTLGGGSVTVVRAEDAIPPPQQSVATTSPAAAAAAAMESVYFGVGCFWHIQHEFIAAERDLLGRSDRELTAFTGYAGGTATDSFGRVCYHNFQNVADYGKYGHGEVVGMKLPTEKIVDFTKVYFSLYNQKTLDRVDPQDRGGEYRSLIGLPGGTLHPLYPAIEETASKSGFTLQVGKGNDPDTLGKQTVYVYDTATFPFYQAEIYHQFHNDFQSPAYGATYNKLSDLAFADGRIQTTGCPDKV